jgi:hypothetical protein
MADEIEDVWKYLEALVETGEPSAEQQLCYDSNTGKFYVLQQGEEIPIGWLPIPGKEGGCLC